MYGYIADHNYGTTLVLSDGRVFEQREQPGGDNEWYLSEEGVNIEAFALEATEQWSADWRMLDNEEEISERIDLEKADDYYVGEPPRNRR